MLRPLGLVEILQITCQAIRINRGGGNVKSLLVVVGLVFILEGVPWFMSPLRVRNLLLDLARFPESVLRGCGLLAMVFGLLLVWMGH